jgi:hypothetical protein
MWLSSEEVKNPTVRDCATKHGGQVFDRFDKRSYAEFKDESSAFRFLACVREYTGGIDLIDPIPPWD